MSSLRAPDQPRRDETLRLSERLSRPPGLIPISADLGGSCCHPDVTLTSAESSASTGSRGAAAGLATGSGRVLGQEVDAGAKREAGVGVAEELLHLDGVPARAEEGRRAGVAEGSEPPRCRGQRPRSGSHDDFRVAFPNRTGSC